MAGAFLLGRFLFGGFFLFSGLNHFLSLAQDAHLAAAKGVPFPEAAVMLTGGLLIAGGLSILLGWRPELGITAIVVFLVLVTPMMHNFWDESGAERMADTVNFLKNVGLAGGSLMLAAIPRPWIYSVEQPERVRA
jgi:putative oxidoreductase